MDSARLTTTAQQRPLESLPLAVQRVNNVTVLVQQFLDRFYGDAPKDSDAASDTAEPMHHNACLDRLFAALDRLETRAATLNDIG